MRSWNDATTAFPPILGRAAMLLGVALIVANEVWTPFPAFRLASFGLSFMALAALAVSLRGSARDVTTALASIVFALGALELAANLIERKDAQEVTPGLFANRPVIGLGPAHPGVYRERKIDPRSGAVIYDASYTIDFDLLRLTRSGPGPGAIVFVGDSMTFGVGVADSETMPQILADRLGRNQRVVNLAFSGHGPQHFLRELETGFYDAEIGADPRAFVFTTAAWHAERAACKVFYARFSPRYVIDRGGVTFKGECHTRVGLGLLRFLSDTAIYRVFVEPIVRRARPSDIELYVAILTRAIRLAAEQKGVPTIILYLRSGAYLEGTGISDDEIMRRLQEAGAVVMDASLAREAANGARLAIAGDGHPTPLAHRMRAEILKGLFDDPSPQFALSSQR